MKTKIILLTLLAINVVAADFFKVGGSFYYLAEPQASRTSHSSTSLSFTSTSDLSVDSLTLMGDFYVEHQIFLLPNFRYTYRPDLTYSYDINITSTTLSGLSTGAASRSVTLTQTDLTPYYQIIDSVFELDLGLTIKSLSGSSTITQSGTDHEYTLSSDPLFMGYARIGIATDYLGLHVDGRYGAYGDNKIIDAKALLSILIKIDAIGTTFSLEGGYSYESIQSGSSDFATQAYLVGIGASY